MTDKLRVLVIGAGQTGSRVLRQLQKDASIHVTTADPRADPLAVKEGLIKAVDIHEALTPLTFKHVIEEAKPDLIFLAMRPEDMGLGAASGVDILVAELQKEIAALAKVPVIEVSPAHA